MAPDRVAFLACGWSLPRPKAHGNATALQRDGETVLVDAGGGVAKQLVRIDGLETLEKIYLTHEHPDHIASVPELIHSLRFTDRTRALELAGPPGALTRTREAIEALGVTCPFDLQWTEIDVEVGGDELATWAPLDHSVPTLGYRFDDVAILGDTGPCEAAIDLADGCSLLVHEATHTDEDRCHPHGHSTPSDAARVASRANVDTLALIHIHPSLPPKQARDATDFPQALVPDDGDVAVRSDEGWRIM